MSLVPNLAQGVAKPASQADKEKDLQTGITKPNLHRRVDNESSSLWTDCLLMTQDNFVLSTQNNYELCGDVEVTGNTDGAYTLLVSSVNSYRVTKQTIHNDDSNPSEIP